MMMKMMPEDLESSLGLAILSTDAPPG